MFVYVLILVDFSLLRIESAGSREAMSETEAQNIYDNPEFFAGYAQLNRSKFGLEEAPEWESVRQLIPEIYNSRVLDLGCGYGWFCRWVVERGAASVLGIDISEKMIAKAKSMSQSEENDKVV